MTDHQFFIAGAYGMAALAFLLEIIWLRVRATRTVASLRESRQMGDA